MDTTPEGMTLLNKGPFGFEDTDNCESRTWSFPTPASLANCRLYQDDYMPVLYKLYIRPAYVSAKSYQCLLCSEHGCADPEKSIQRLTKTELILRGNAGYTTSGAIRPSLLCQAYL